MSDHGMNERDERLPVRDTSVAADGRRGGLRMESRVWKEIWLRIGSREPETGGVLLGPADQDLVTDFFFDASGRCTAGSYTPDHETINRKHRSSWKPAGLQIKGMVHSHPRWFITLSAGDLAYIRRILDCNPDMPRFLAPVVIPERFWIRPFVVYRDPWTVEETVLEVVDSE